MIYIYICYTCRANIIVKDINNNNQFSSRNHYTMLMGFTQSLHGYTTLLYL